VAVRGAVGGGQAGRHCGEVAQAYLVMMWHWEWAATGVSGGVDIVEGASPGVQPAYAHARSDVALGMGFKLLKIVSAGGGDCLGRVITHLGSLDCCSRSCS